MRQEPFSSGYWARAQRLRLSRRRILAAGTTGAIGVAGFAAVGCGNDDDSETPPATTNGDETPQPGQTPANGNGEATASAGEVSIAQASLDTQDADPHNGVSGIQEPIRFGQATGLFRTDIEGNVVPAVAEGIEIGDDGLSWTIHVREGITFTNGDPLTAEDVDFSIQRMMNASALSALWTSFVDDTELIDDTTVRVHMNSIAPAFLYRLHGLYTIPREYTLGLGDGDYASSAFHDQPIAVGPYRLVDNQIGRHIAFEAYDEYFVHTPSVRNVQVTVVPERTTRVAQLQAGEIDIVHGLLPDNIDTVEGISGARIARSEGAGTSELTFFDMMDPASPFHDDRVRKALCHAVDREAIIDNLYRGEGIVLNIQSIKGPFTVGYDADLFNEEPFPYDPQEAMALLDAAGWGDGFDTQITTYDTTTTPGTPEMMEIVSDYLRHVGVNAPVRFMEAGQYVGLFRDKDLEGMGPISFPSSPDFATEYENHYLEGAAFSYDNWEEGDELWRQIQAETDLEAREEMSVELVRRLSRERVPNIALVGPNALFGLGPRVADYPRPPAMPYSSHLDYIRLA